MFISMSQTCNGHNLGWKSRGWPKFKRLINFCLEGNFLSEFWPTFPKNHQRLPYSISGHHIVINEVRWISSIFLRLQGCNYDQNKRKINEIPVSFRDQKPFVPSTETLSSQNLLRPPPLISKRKRKHSPRHPGYGYDHIYPNVSIDVSEVQRSYSGMELLELTWVLVVFQLLSGKVTFISFLAHFFQKSPKISLFHRWP